MDDERLNDAVRMAVEFDAIIDCALDEREEPYGLPVYADHPLHRHRVQAFPEAFQDGDVLPVARRPGAVVRAIDVKLQSYLTELVGGLVNDHYFTRVNADPTQADRASLQLMLISLHQDQIIKTLEVAGCL